MHMTLTWGAYGRGHFMLPFPHPVAFAGFQSQGSWSPLNGTFISPFLHAAWKHHRREASRATAPWSASMCCQLSSSWFILLTCRFFKLIALHSVVELMWCSWITNNRCARGFFSPLTTVLITWAWQIVLNLRKRENTQSRLNQGLTTRTSGEE